MKFKMEIKNKILKNVYVTHSLASCSFLRYLVEARQHSQNTGKQMQTVVRSLARHRDYKGHYNLAGKAIRPFLDMKLPANNEGREGKLETSKMRK